MKNSGYADIKSSNGGGKSKSSSKKGKEKCVGNEIGSSKDVLKKHLVEDTAVVLGDGHHSSKGKSKISVEEINLNSGNHFLEGRNGSEPADGSSKKNARTGEGGKKQPKKVSKFLGNRLGDDAIALAELGDVEISPGPIEVKTDRDKDPPEGLPVRGVWQNGGGRRLVKMTMRAPPRRGVV